jgi:hypothetical protein
MTENDDYTPTTHAPYCGVWDSPVGGVSGWCDCGLTRPRQIPR